MSKQKTGRDRIDRLRRIFEVFLALNSEESDSILCILKILEQMDADCPPSKAFREGILGQVEKHVDSLGLITPDWAEVSL